MILATVFDYVEICKLYHHVIFFKVGGGEANTQPVIHCNISEVEKCIDKM